jgi:hypothetical protein
MAERTFGFENRPVGSTRETASGCGFLVFRGAWRSDGPGFSFFGPISYAAAPTRHMTPDFKPGCAGSEGSVEGTNGLSPESPPA